MNDVAFLPMTSRRHRLCIA